MNKEHKDIVGNFAIIYFKSGPARAQVCSIELDAYGRKIYTLKLLGLRDYDRRIVLMDSPDLRIITKSLKRHEGEKTTQANQ